MNFLVYFFFIISLINVVVSYLIYKEIQLLKKQSIGKQGPPGPMGSKGDPGESCKCQESNKEHNALLKDEKGNILMEFNSLKHKPWADYIEENE